MRNATNTPPEPPPGSATTAERDLADLELLRQQAVEGNEAAKGIRATEAKAIRRHLARLESFIQEFLAKYTDGSVSADDPDLDHRLFEWNAQLGRGEVPAEFRGRSLEQDPTKAGDFLYYALLVRILRSSVEQGLGSALPAGRLVADGREVEVRIETLRIEGDPSAVSKLEEQNHHRNFEAARGFDEAFPPLVEALRLALGLLASMDPGDLIRGARQLHQAREAGRKEKYARGIQAAVDEVYREGMTEEACWEALSEVDGCEFTVEGSKYVFYVDRRGDAITAACQTEDRNGQERSIQGTSFHPYFVRARDAQSP